MGLFRSSLRNSILAAACLLPLSALALDLPAGTEIQIRLKSKISSKTARPQDPVEALVIAPVIEAGQFAIPAGAPVHGTVDKVTSATKPDERSVLALNFTGIEVDGAKLKLAARVTAVDNARETIDDQGQINGILASETMTGKMDSGIEKLGERFSGLAGVLGAAKSVVFKQADSDIEYSEGVEMTLTLTAPLSLKGPAKDHGPAGKLKAMPDRSGLARLVAHEPFQTVAEKPPKPSDITNILLVGDEAAVKKVFGDAGWYTAQSLNALAKFETIRALAEDRGYNEAPVSVLLLDGRPPDLVFEKLNNTFARRHHLRVWARPATFQGKPVWAVAATHDTGISFSEENRTFIHKIDSSVDKERDKVANDLLFTGLRPVARDGGSRGRTEEGSECHRRRGGDGRQDRGAAVAVGRRPRQCRRTPWWGSSATFSGAWRSGMVNVTGVFAEATQRVTVRPRANWISTGTSVLKSSSTSDCVRVR